MTPPLSVGDVPLARELLERLARGLDCDELGPCWEPHDCVIAQSDAKLLRALAVALPGLVADSAAPPVAWKATPDETILELLERCSRLSAALQVSTVENEHLLAEVARLTAERFSLIAANLQLYEEIAQLTRERDEPDWRAEYKAQPNVVGSPPLSPPEPASNV